MPKTVPARQSTRDFVEFMKDHAKVLETEGYDASAKDYRRAARLLENLFPDAVLARTARAYLRKNPDADIRELQRLFSK